MLDRKVAFQRLNAPDVLPTEAHRGSSEEAVLGGKQRMHDTVMFMPSDDRNRLIFVDERVGAALLEVHHKDIPRRLRTHSRRGVIVDQPLRQLAENEL